MWWRCDKYIKRKDGKYYYQKFCDHEETEFDMTNYDYPHLGRFEDRNPIKTRIKCKKCFVTMEQNEIYDERIRDYVENVEDATRAINELRNNMEWNGLESDLDHHLFDAASIKVYNSKKYDGKMSDIYGDRKLSKRKKKKMKASGNRKRWGFEKKKRDKRGNQRVREKFKIWK